MLEFIRPHPNSIFNVPNILDIHYLTRLHVGLRHLRDHKLRRNFRDSLSPRCACVEAIEATKHDFLKRYHFGHYMTRTFSKK